MPHLYLVRHGEPALKGVILGRHDVGLSDLGREQACALNNLEAAIAYVSPLKRALETAAALPHSIPRMVLDDLCEIGQGEWETKSWAQIEAEYPQIAHERLQSWFTVAPPGGESWEQARRRAERVIERIRQGPLPAISVAHQGIHSVIASLLRGSDPLSFKQHYCEVRICEL